MKIRLYGKVINSIVDGPGIRYSIYTQGCAHHCKNCHNPKSWDFKGGIEEDTTDIINEILRDKLVSGITFSGGDPIYQYEACLKLIEDLRVVSDKHYDVAVWTGFTFEELLSDQKYRKFLTKIDVIVDGPYMDDLRDLKLKWRGSSNQRIIDVKESLKQGKAVLTSDPRWL